MDIGIADADLDKINRMVKGWLKDIQTICKGFPLFYKHVEDIVVPEEPKKQNFK